MTKNEIQNRSLRPFSLITDAFYWKSISDLDITHLLVFEGNDPVGAGFLPDDPTKSQSSLFYTT